MAKTALVVDTSATMREVVSYTLREAGFEILMAGDGRQALQVLEGNSVDLIISDLQMPVTDGLTFIRSARQREGLEEVPILMLTTESHASVKEQGKAAGVTEWLVKPLNPDMLLRVIAKVVP